MNKAKLNLVRLNSGDVIATSPCNSVYGVTSLYYDEGTGELSGLWYMNNSNYSGNLDKDYLDTLHDVIPGFYHINSDHEITGKCSCESWEEAEVSHNLTD